MNRIEANLVRVAAAIPQVKVGNVQFNLEQIKDLVGQALEKETDVILFPELSITGYSCGDLFHQEALLKAANDGIQDLLEFSKGKPIIIIVGAPLVGRDGRLMNSALVICNGFSSGQQDKRNLPNYKEFYEKRWFAEGERSSVWDVNGRFTFGIEICEDVWAPLPPCTEMVRRGADIIFNLSTSNELIGKHAYLVSMLKQRSADHICGYVYASSGYGESTQDLTFMGNAMIFENGKFLAKDDRSLESMRSNRFVISDIDIESLRNERRTNTTFSKFLGSGRDDEFIPYNAICGFKDDYEHKEDTLRTYNGQPFVPSINVRYRAEEILRMQVLALSKRLEHTGMKPVIGVSGGSDSTWALIVIRESMKFLGKPASDIVAVSMPGFATSNRTKTNARLLSEAVGADFREIDITEICRAELRALGHDEEIQDITYENVQARTRTQILMNLSNQVGGLVIGTGDLSELALGWCTYNADHMSMYGVNASVPKTLIKALIEEYSKFSGGGEDLGRVLTDILKTPVSPELKGTGAGGDQAQVTEDNIGPYELHDFFLYNMIRHGFGPKKIFYLSQHVSGWKEKFNEETIKKWLKVFIKRFFTQQFKRSCLPDGPKIGSISLSPRGDWRMPSDACMDVWMKELREL
jgi:NAD+ synthase (glutamine-hydrolysing)